ncbi:MAG: nucleoside-diphosphate kinase [Deltaproteobacteria bacterium]|nr:nucleoside-diphosphate kinase [Deltaproteobacteria bacterium]
MAIERTLSIIKPDAVKRDLVGKIYTLIEGAGLKLIGIKMLKLSDVQAKEFYAVHKERPFYKDLCAYMTSGPVVVACLEGESAVNKYREIMGATNPADAKDGTIRKLYAESLQNNSVHGSDSVENAKTEVRFFFGNDDLCPR